MTKRKSFKIIILTIIVALLLLSTIGVVLAESAGYMTDYVFSLMDPICSVILRGLCLGTNLFKI